MSADIALPWIPNSNLIPNRYPQSCMSVSLMGDLLSIMRAQFADWFAINAIPERHRSTAIYAYNCSDRSTTNSNNLYIHLSIHLSIYLSIVESCQMCATLDETRDSLEQGVCAGCRQGHHVVLINWIFPHTFQIWQNIFFSLVFWWLCSALRAAKNKSWKLLRKVNMMVIFSQTLYTLTQDDYGECW